MTNAERQRRYRERKRTDQQKPAPADTSPVTSPVTGDDVTGAPELDTRGRRLWQDITGEAGELRPTERLLLEEACRLADRLDRLDQILTGTAGDWLRFHSANEDGTVVKVVVTAALVEVRQQQVALKALLSELRTSRGAGGKPMGRGQVPQTSSKGGAGVTDLAARIAARRRSPTG